MSPSTASASRPRTDIRDVSWCYDRLDDPGVTSADAPSLGAWHMLGWAREHRDHFYTSLLPRALVAQAKASHPGKLPAAVPHSKPQQLLECPNYAELDREWLRVWGVTDELLAEARQLVDDWAREASVALDERCKAGLASCVAEIVRGAVDAAKRYPQAFVKYFD
jgi:hypothetical protein